MTEGEGQEHLGDVTNNEFDHENGRPTKQEQLKIERELRPYFESGHSASFTSNKTGYDIKTVLRHFNKWMQEIFEPENNDFLKRVKEQKERTLIHVENKIDTLNKLEKEIDELREASKRAGDFNLFEKLTRTKLKIIDTVSKFIAEKINLVNVASFDVLVELDKLGEKKDGL